MIAWLALQASQTWNCYSAKQPRIGNGTVGTSVSGGLAQRRLVWIVHEYPHGWNDSCLSKRMLNLENLRPIHPDQPVILIAEDETMIQNIIRVRLEKDGYFVQTAENGEVALLLSQQYSGHVHL